MMATDSSPAAPPKRARELGRIDFVRGYDTALAEAKKVDRPVLILFQEIPGCETCTNYGDRVLSHPLVVEAVESLFVPLVVVNNSGGDDVRVLKLFEEPANNNPVVRIISPAGQALAPRVAENYAIPGLTRAMITALKASGRQVPEYLQLLHDESDARVRGVERATLAMQSTQEGEAKLGGIKGVVSTTSAILRQVAVVEVEFDSSVIDYARLLKMAVNLKCADGVFTRRDEQQEIANNIVGTSARRTDQFSVPDKQSKFHARGTPFQHVPMSPLQAARVNNALAEKKDARRFLSPRQLGLLDRVQAHPDAGWPVALDAVSMSAAWTDLDEIVVKIEAGKR